LTELVDTDRPTLGVVLTAITCPLESTHLSSRNAVLSTTELFSGFFLVNALASTRHQIRVLTISMARIDVFYASLWVAKVLINRTRNIEAGIKDSQRRTNLGFILTLTLQGPSMSVVLFTLTLLQLYGTILL